MHDKGGRSRRLLWYHCAWWQDLEERIAILVRGRTVSERDEGIEYLKKVILRERGFDCDQYKSSYLKRRLSVRLRETSARNYHDYARILKRDKDEFGRLLDTLSIGVTEFFRDRDVFKRLMVDVIPDIVSRKRDRGSLVLSAWSAGCASGEEAYSLAILLLEAVSGELAQWNISVLGTDVDRSLLERARKGTYGEEHLAEIPGFESYFETKEEGAEVFIEVKDDVRRITSFRKMDLLSFNPSRKFDIVLCRNVLIYFSGSVQASVIERLVKSLRRGGYLVLGKAETLRENIAGVKAVFPRERIFRNAG